MATFSHNKQSVTSTSPFELRKAKERRNYLMILNNSANDITVRYSSPGIGAEDGDIMVSNARVEFWGDWCPNNEAIWIFGTVGTDQDIRIIEGYAE